MLFPTDPAGSDRIAEGRLALASGSAGAVWAWSVFRKYYDSKQNVQHGPRGRPEYQSTTRGEMSHQHACDVAGHYWQCEGVALRPIAGHLEPTICMCPFCEIPMEEGDHGGCPVELLACPQHQDEQLQEMANSVRAIRFQWG
jgi:hypothetical protein